ncbi:hypothetical protein [Neisseria sp. P0016.S006]|uniref:hypothetical protein n=1 Tax=Neisseria sp. P0016.S006 TaxID=3436772 RepID=UPI003F80657E
MLGLFGGLWLWCVVGGCCGCFGVVVVGCVLFGVFWVGGVGFGFFGVGGGLCVW